MKTVTIAQALQTYLEVEEAKASAQHPEKNIAECPTLKEWADHVLKKLPLRRKQYAHALRCHYCQITQRQFLLPPGGRVIKLLQPLQERLVNWRAAAAESPGQCDSAESPMQRKRFLPAVLATDGDTPAQVDLTHGPFLSAKGRLNLTINVVQPVYKPEELPVHLQLVVWPEGTVLHTFELPDLRAQKLTVKLPKELLEQEQWRNIEKTWPNLKPEELPLRCVLEAGCQGLADEEPAPGHSTSSATTEKEVRHGRTSLERLLRRVLDLGSRFRQRATAPASAPGRPGRHLGIVATEA